MNTPMVDANADLGQQVETDRIEEIVLRRLQGRVSDFRLLVLASGLILRGRTFSYHAKQLVQHAVMEATIAPILANEIEVR